MTTETIVCDRCGAVLRIETDDPKYLEKRKTEFTRTHERCQQVEAIKDSAAAI